MGHGVRGHPSAPINNRNQFSAAIAQHDVVTAPLGPITSEASRPCSAATRWLILHGRFKKI